LNSRRGQRFLSLRRVFPRGAIRNTARRPLLKSSPRTINYRKGRCTMNAQGIHRRLFLGSAVGGLALRSSRTARADTAFTNFSFAATGAPTKRTMPDRLSDIINVKDWGAVGDGVNDDRSAIQGAINYLMITKATGGKVFLPPGNYALKSPPYQLVVGGSSQ